jgi:ABC-type multidrug transport system fused ATPase/permease subunit
METESRTLARRLARVCLRFPGPLVASAALVVALRLTQLGLTWEAKLWVEALVGGDPTPLPKIFTAMAALIVAMAVALFASRLLITSLTQAVLATLRDAAAERLLSLDVTAARARAAGDSIARVFHDADVLGGFVDFGVRRFLGDSLLALGAIGMMFYLDFWLALATCVLVPVVGVLLSLLGGVIRRRSSSAQKQIGSLTATLSEQLHGLSTIKSFQTETHESRRFALQNALYRSRILSAEAFSSLLITSVWLTTGLGLLVIVFFGSQSVFSHRLSPGSLLAFCLYAGQTVEPLRRLSEVHGLLQRSLASAARVFEVIDLPFVEKDGSLHVPEGPLSLSIQGLSFRHRSDQPLFESLSFSLSPNQSAALVAQSGGGKSTLAQLLVRFLQPQQGRILLNGVDVSEMRLSDLRRAVCVVEQEPFLFSGALLDNLRYGSFDTPLEKVRQAVGLAGLDPLVASFPLGLHEPLLESGRNLSGGQKQRIALVRAILRSPRLLVLDEATSALDSDSEEAIFDRLAPWLVNRTVLVLAHRLSTIARLPRILLLKNGQIAADGSLHSLLASSPDFNSLFAAQFDGGEEAD